MRIVLIALLLINNLFLYSQTVDSIVVIVDSEYEKITLIEKDPCSAYQKYNKIAKTSKDSALYYQFLANKFSQNCADDRIKADASFDLAMKLTYLGEYALAQPYYELSLQKYIFLKDTNALANTYKAIGVNNRRMSVFVDALVAFNHAASFYHLTKNKIGIATIELNIGNIHKNMNRFDAAKDKYHSALSLFKELNKNESIADCYNNMGNVFKNEEKYDSAFHYMYLTLSSRLMFGPERKLGYVYHNLANLHSKLGALDSATWYIDKSIKIKQKLGNLQNLSTDYLTYGGIYMKKGNLRQAIWAFEKSRELNAQLESQDYDYQTSLDLANAYLKLEDYKSASKNYANYFKQRDALQLKNNPVKLANELIQYEYLKDSIEKEKIIIEKDLIETKHHFKQLSNKSIKNKLYFISGILALLLLMIILLFTSFRKRLNLAKEHRTILALQNEELKRTLVSKEEKETLLKEIHHRVKNNLQIISSLVRLQSGYINKTNFKERLNELENRILSMALVHEKLYQSNDLSKLEVKNYIRDLSVNILDSYSTTKKVKFVFDIDASRFSIDTLIPLGLILNETISNALKHAFFDSEESVITIHIKTKKDVKTTMVIKDNGIGAELSMDELMEDSLGLDLIFTLTEQLDGKLEVDTTNGFVLTFTFPALA